MFHSAASESTVVTPRLARPGQLLAHPFVGGTARSPEAGIGAATPRQSLPPPHPLRLTPLPHQFPAAPWHWISTSDPTRIQIEQCGPSSSFVAEHKARSGLLTRTGRRRPGLRLAREWRPADAAAAGGDGLVVGGVGSHDRAGSVCGVATFGGGLSPGTGLPAPTGDGCTDWACHNTTFATGVA